MPPPFRTVWPYFRHDADVYMREHRAHFSTADKKHTIATLWHGSDTVRAHYDGCAHSSPGPGLPIPNPIPVDPYTAADERHARETGELPPQDDEEQDGDGHIGEEEELQEGANAANEVDGSDGAEVGGALDQESQAGGEEAPDGGLRVDQGSQSVNGPQPDGPAQPNGAVDITADPGGHFDRRPYHFWPQLPWDDEPDLRLPGRNADDGATRVWLRGRPHRFHDEQRWHGVALLGIGGYGIAGLWVETDDSNNIIDRMAIKDIRFPLHYQWRDPKNWRDRKPQEIRIHELVEERRNVDPDACRHLIHYFGHRLYMKQKRYRVYLDFCSAGNLHSGMNGVRENWEKKASERDDSRFVPETFVWYVIKALASACLILENGTLGAEPIDGWKPIRHLDLQLANLFLQDSERTKDTDVNIVTSGKGSRTAMSRVDDSNEAARSVNMVPEPPLVPILSDFGLSFYSLSDEDDCPYMDNPEDYLWGGAQLRYAPEHQVQEGPDYTPLDEKTDVWGIGYIAWQLIVNKTTQHGPVREDLFPKDPVLKQLYGGYLPASIDHPRNKKQRRFDDKAILAGGVKFPAASKYSVEVKNLVRNCLNFFQDERPSLRDLLQEADDFLRGPDSEADSMDLVDLELDIPDFSEFELGKKLDAKHRPRDDGYVSPVLVGSSH